MVTIQQVVFQEPGGLRARNQENYDVGTRMFRMHGRGGSRSLIQEGQDTGTTISAD